ncbi:MAG: hypothetical protein KGS45_07840 [Planctomycetes bacterium]|nr:hypothetical protein [Planctomycetota bacterium]
MDGQQDHTNPIAPEVTDAAPAAEVATGSGDTVASDAIPDAAGTSESGPAPFRWGMFAQHVATILIVCMAIAVVGGIVIGYRPLHRTARQSVVASPLKVDVVWPGTEPPAGKEAPKTIVDDAVAQAKKIAEANGIGQSPSGNGTVRTASMKEAGKENVTLDAPKETWLPKQFQDEVTTLIQANLGQDPAVFSRDPLVSVGIALERSGWFDGMPTVARSNENTIRVSGTWRIPVATIVFKPTEHDVDEVEQLISSTGHPMPVTYRPGTSALPRIVGLGTRPVMQTDGQIDYNSRWTSADAPQNETLDAALELLRTVSEQPWGKQVGGIDARDYLSTKSLTILTRDESRIVFGGRPSQPLLGETSTKAKLARIGEIYKRFGSIDAKRAAIDISGVHPVEINIAATATPDLVDDQPSAESITQARKDAKAGVKPAASKTAAKSPAKTPAKAPSKTPAKTTKKSEKRSS